MKQRPILFSTPMVQAILEGRKTMTRRVVKIKEHQPTMTLEFLQDTYPRFQFKSGNIHWQIECPYGQPGDVLWVRETFISGCVMEDESFVYDEHDEQIEKTWYKADNDLYNWFNGREMTECIPWKPSIHMPKDAARLWLRITNVRVERVEDISSEDCVNEGISKTHLGWKNYDGSPDWFSQPRDSFHSLWKSIHGKDWRESNPWVWVVEFERIECPEQK